MASDRQSWAPRWLHRMWANANGYFWLECRVCGRFFGGHEAREYKGKLVSAYGRLVCPAESCQEYGLKQMGKGVFNA